MGSASGVYFKGNFAMINLLKSLAIISEKGTPDIFIPKVKKNEMGFIVAAGLFIELKKVGGVASGEQLAMIDRLQDEGYYAFIVEGSDMAINIIKDYLDIGDNKQQENI